MSGLNGVSNGLSSRYFSAPQIIGKKDDKGGKKVEESKEVKTHAVAKKSQQTRPALPIQIQTETSQRGAVLATGNMSMFVTDGDVLVSGEVPIAKETYGGSLAYATSLESLNVGFNRIQGKVVQAVAGTWDENTDAFGGDIALLTDRGEVWVLGDNLFGEIGGTCGTSINSFQKLELDPYGDGFRAISISMGGGALVISGINQEGQPVVKSLGNNEFGQLGHPTYTGDNECNSTPTDVRVPESSTPPIFYIPSSGRTHGMLTGYIPGVNGAPSHPNELILWGTNDANANQLCNPNTFGLFNPYIYFTGHLDAPAVARGDQTAYSVEGKAYYCGSDSDYKTYTSYSTKVPYLMQSYSRLFLGNNTELFGLHVDSDNLYAWGANNYGQGANGTSSPIYVPEKISETIHFVSSGNHTLFIEDDCNVYAAGNNNNYQLGNGAGNSDIQESMVPVLRDKDFQLNLCEK
ncbi:hypothetical protein A2246_00585 [candidate division WOR-1 bacterium RIFOXYA2_FULL_37_7]|uniref:Uncharacterized protein n=1 Tax=candidate division WOR-1 bacterium RIFOXYB2_FULL_37_13 TaxID=1802579 RepID=A0A1F4SQR6_UNCSA|nr:MAG: hypothetical protein A2246_00585 [candidate division WOR-1 bacterium RIFOXYA2_FULL_37_7]OGC22759.1 MAG: hypothetical protein A2310_05380 [candidate division WOR-1 bacterium RIFOXYB2_FULL_37_13]